MANNSSEGEGIVWLIVAGLCIWLAYDKWWKEPDLPSAPAPIYTPAAPLPSGPIATLPDGTVWRMVWDKVKGPRASRLAWVRADHSKNKEQKARESMTLYLINCDTTGFRTLSSVDYNKDGKVLQQWGEETYGKVQRYPPPDSFIEGVVVGACQSRFDPEPTPTEPKTKA